MFTSRLFGGTPTTSVPRSRIVPSSGSSKPAIMRIVVPVGPTGTDAGTGSSLLVAVRPERVELRSHDAPPRDGSRLSGTVAQVVYLGTLTQFHVDASIGKRLIVHHLSDDRSSDVREGDAVVLTWSRDDAAVLGA